MEKLSEKYTVIVGYTKDGGDADITDEIIQLETVIETVQNWGREALEKWRNIVAVLNALGGKS